MIFAKNNRKHFSPFNLNHKRFFAQKTRNFHNFHFARFAGGFVNFSIQME